MAYLLRNTSERQKTLDTLKILLNDEETFHHVCNALFNAIDKNKDGSLEKSEIRGFIDKICDDMGLEKKTDDETLDEVFKELDADGGGDVSVDELESFLRRIFILQRDEINRVIQMI